MSEAWRSSALVLAIILFVHTLASWLLLNSQGPAPLLDEPVYISLAKSLATRGEYRSIFLPGEPYHTKYPILYPWMISWVWKMSPDFPHNVLYLRFFSLVLALGSLWIVWVLLRRMTGYRQWLGGVVVAVFAVHPALLANSTAISSEPAYLLSSFLVVFLTLRQEKEDRIVWTSFLCGVALALTIYIRVVGITLLLAVLLYQAALRRWRPMVVIALTTMSLLSPWLYWSHTHDESARFPEYIYSTNYVMDSWQLIQTQGLAFVLLRNMVVLAVGIPKTMIFPFQSDLHRLTLLTAWVGFPVLALLSMNFYRSLRSWDRKRLLGQFYVVCYLGALLFWPYQTGERFLLPVLPFLLWILSDELLDIKNKAERHLARSKDSIHKLEGVVFTTVSLIIVSAWVGVLVYHGVRFFRARVDEVNAYHEQERARLETCGWIRRETKPGDSLMAYLDPVYYLYSSRKTAPIIFEAGHEMTSPRFLLEPIRKHGIRYMVVGDLDFGVYTPDVVAAMNRELQEVIQGKYGLHFQRVFLSAERKVEVYKISDERPTSVAIQ